MNTGVDNDTDADTYDVGISDAIIISVREIIKSISRLIIGIMG